MICKMICKIDRKYTILQENKNYILRIGYFELACCLSSSIVKTKPVKVLVSDNYCEMGINSLNTFTTS